MRQPTKLKRLPKISLLKLSAHLDEFKSFSVLLPLNSSKRSKFGFFAKLMYFYRQEWGKKETFHT